MDQGRAAGNEKRVTIFPLSPPDTISGALTETVLLLLHRQIQRRGWTEIQASSLP
jgi:hypothetical protein